MGNTREPADGALRCPVYNIGWLMAYDYDIIFASGSGDVHTDYRLPETQEIKRNEQI